MAAAPKIVYSLVPKARYTEVAEIMTKNYYSMETVSSKLGLFRSGVPPLIKEIHETRLQLGTSYFAQDENSKKILGFMIAGEHREWDNEIMAKVVQTMFPHNPDGWAAFTAVMKACMKGYSTEEELLGVKKTFRLFDAYVDPAYRKFGIGGEVIRLAAELGKAGDFDAVTATCTTRTTSRVLENVGFDVVSKVYYKDIMHNGKPVLDDPEAFAAFVAFVKKPNK